MSFRLSECNERTEKSHCPSPTALRFLHSLRSVEMTVSVGVVLTRNDGVAQQYRGGGQNGGVTCFKESYFEN